MFTKKDRKIANLNAKVKNRENTIDILLNTNENLKKMVKSLTEDNESLVEQSFIQYKNKLLQTN